MNLQIGLCIVVVVGVGFGVVLIVLRALIRRDASGDQWETEGRE